MTDVSSKNKSAEEISMEEYEKILKKDIKDVKDEIKQKYAQELQDMEGLSDEEIEQLGGTTSQMNEVIKEVQNATDQNLKQADLINNLKKLGKSTYSLAKKILDFLPG